MKPAATFLAALALALTSAPAFALDPHVEAVARIVTGAKGKVEMTADGQGVKLIDLNVPGSGPHPGVPGNYLHGSVVQAGADGAAGSWAVHLHDREDGASLYEARSMKEALEKLQEVIASAPFTMNELEGLGFRTM